VLWGRRTINAITGPAGRARTLVPGLLRALTDRPATARCTGWSTYHQVSPARVA
jgi:hypothetical protein